MSQLCKEVLLVEMHDMSRTTMANIQKMKRCRRPQRSTIDSSKHDPEQKTYCDGSDDCIVLAMVFAILLVFCICGGMGEDVIMTMTMKRGQYNEREKQQNVVQFDMNKTKER
eukprot:276452_1